MGERPPRRELPRPEGVGPDWLTKKQAMGFANIPSDYLFRKLAEQTRGQFPDEIIEEGASKPTWVSPRFAKYLKHLNATPDATANMMAEKSLVPIVGCGSEYISGWVAACLPSAEEAQIMRAPNGQIVMHFSIEYAERLRAFKEAHPDMEIVRTRESRVGLHIYRARFIERCTELQGALQKQLETVTFPEEKFTLRQMMAAVEKLIADISETTDPQVKEFVHRLEALQESVDIVTHNVVAIKKATPKPIAPQQPGLEEPVSRISRRIPEVSTQTSPEQDRNQLEDIAACEQILDGISTAQTRATLSAHIKKQLSELRFAFETFRAKLHRGESIDQFAFVRTMKKAQALLEGKDRDDD